MIKPLSVIATTIAMFAALTMTATPAVAAGSCSIIVPAKVQIDRPYKVITATLGSDCAASSEVYASWDVVHTWYGWNNLFIFDAKESSSLDFYDWEHVGTYDVRPSSAWDADYNELTQNTRTMVVKYTTWSYTASSRAGNAVYINALIKNWSSNDLVRGSGRTVYLQRYIGGVWQNMLARTANSTGQFTVGFIQPKVYQYRLVATETSTAWSGNSASTTR